MNKTYILFTCDAHHTRQSEEIIGVATTFKKGIELIKAHAKKEGCKISEDDLYLLEKIKQTQNHEGEYEYMIEEFINDTLN